MYNDKNFKTAHPLTFGLSMVAGLGVILMITALAVGVIQPDANTYVIGMLLVGGLAFFLVGVGGWLGITRPFTHFDDITKPVEDDHGHGHAHEALPAGTDDHGHPLTVVDEALAGESHGTGHH